MKKLLSLASLILVCCTGFAQGLKAKTLLWQITGPGITKPSYLYGTIHLMCPDDIIITPVLKQKFDATKQLYLELDLDDPGTMTDAMAGMMMKNNVTIKQLLPENQYDSVAKNFQKLTGISLTLMGNVQPMLAEAAIYPALLGCAGEAWEQKFMKMAKAASKETKGLETTQDQLDIFDSIPYKEQAEMFAKSLQNIDSLKISFKQLLNIYKKRDLDSLSLMMNDDPEEGKYDDIMLNRRNAKWIPEIIEQAQKMPTFIAVGAGHLGGEKGVIAMLRKRGYTVTPVMY